MPVFDDANVQVGAGGGLQRVLMLQGPMGPFFGALADGLENAGIEVLKVNLNAGDRLFFNDERVVDYRGSLSAWPSWLEDFMVRHRIDTVLLFGDRRPYHVCAIEIAKRRQIEVFVFEEGYLRPNFVTLEAGGVNARSPACTDRTVHDQYVHLAVPEAAPVGRVFWPATFRIAAYAWANHLRKRDYPHYEHHRPLHPVGEGLRWIAGGLKKLRWQHRDRGKLGSYQGELSGRYFLCPLQVHNDSQVADCAAFPTVEDFIRHVACEFLEHADRTMHLVFKHHPMDRAYRDYSRLMAKLAHDTGLGERLHYVADLHLPTMLRHARGTIVLNSTVGLQSLHHGTPTLALGEAPYVRAGLTFGGDLAAFFGAPGKVDEGAVKAFESYLRHTSQLRGTFYKPDALPSPADVLARLRARPPHR